MSVEDNPKFHRWAVAHQIRSLAERRYWLARITKESSVAQLEADLERAQYEYEAVCEEVKQAE